MKKLALIVSLFLSTNTFAGFEQTVDICGTLEEEIPNSVLAMSFRSTDIYELPKNLNIYNGISCMNVVYHHGPKNIKMNIELNKLADQRTHADVYIVPDSNCGFLVRNADNNGFNGKVSTSAHHESFGFKLKQSPGSPDNLFIYRMSCEHSSV